jgi:hypothetical protein
MKIAIVANEGYFIPSRNAAIWQSARVMEVPSDSMYDMRVVPQPFLLTLLLSRGRTWTASINALTAFASLGELRRLTP